MKTYHRNIIPIMTALVLVLLSFATPTEPATYSTVSGGVALTLNITPQALKKPSGATTILVDGTWSYTKGSLSFTNGIVYPSYWTDYKNGTSAMFENNMTRGAEVLFMFAPPSSACTAGALIQAILEMPNASSFTNAGSPISLTPVSGFICGDPINSFTVYSLSLVTTANISGVGTVTIVPSQPLTGTWSGQWQSTPNRGAGGTLTAVITQSSNAFTGVVSLTGSQCFTTAIPVSGVISGSSISMSGGVISISATLSAGNNIFGSYSISTGPCSGDRGGIDISRRG